MSEECRAATGWRLKFGLYNLGSTDVNDLPILGASGNTDARTLATMIADPQQATEKILGQWVGEVDYYLLADVLVRNLVCKTPCTRKLMEARAQPADEWVGRAGWILLLPLLAMQDKSLTDSY